MSAPLVLGAGPAGSAAAIGLARGGAEPVLIDRDAEIGDALCGGFLSWNTTGKLHALGVDPVALGAHEVDWLVLFAGTRRAEARLPAPAYGLSRRALDGALRGAAVAAGARLEIDKARRIADGRVEGERRVWTGNALFLATGKHDVRGRQRPRQASDPALGLRLRTPASRDLDGRIELHLFAGGYAGIVRQEDGSANICLALRKSLLAGAGGDPRALLLRLASEHPAFAERLDGAHENAPLDTIAAVPYGLTLRETDPGQFRLGDQAAVIPSLAGEGMGIALASAERAVRAYLDAGPDAAPCYQARFAHAARRPLGLAGLLWRSMESERGGPAVTGLTRVAPAMAGLAMRWSRI